MGKLSLPKEFKGYQLKRIDNSIQFGCGAVTVNVTQINAFLRVEEALKANYSGVWNGYRKYDVEAYGIAEAIRFNEMYPRTNKLPKSFRGLNILKTKTGYSIGGFELTFAEYNAYYTIRRATSWRIVHEPSLSYKEFISLRKEITNFAIKLVKILN